MVCSCVEKCYERGASVAVRMAGRDEAEELDRAMWTFHDISFIPHVLAAEAEEPVLEAVIIYCAGEPPGQADMLVEAAAGEPGDHFQQFDHVFDFADVYDESLREAGRRRYKAYQQAGYRMRYIR